MWKRGRGGLIFFYERKTNMPKKIGYGNGSKKPPKK